MEVGRLQISPYIRQIHYWVPHFGCARSDPIRELHFLMFFGFSSLAVAAANVFGLFGFLNSQCVAEKCTAEATRINWIDIHNISNEQGWSMPFPTLGIPDYVALACSIAVIVIALRKK